MRFFKKKRLKGLLIIVLSLLLAISFATGSFALSAGQEKDITGIETDYTDSDFFEEESDSLPGDLDGDGVVTDADAIYLLFYTFFPDDYPVEGNVDYDGDGEITDADAVYLLFYTFFPDDYPLASVAEKKLTVSILGDSISTLKGYIPSNYNVRYVQNESEAVNGLLYITYEQTWWGGLIEDMGWQLGINDSWAGSRVSNASSTNQGNVGPDRAMVSNTRISRLDDNGTPDIIFFYGGTNDIGRDVTIGAFDPNTVLDLEGTLFPTFAEAYAQTLLRLKYYYPDATVISLMPNYTSTYYTDSELEQYNAVIKQICDYYGVKCIDLRGADVPASILADGIHPDAVGMNRVKEYIKTELK